MIRGAIDFTAADRVGGWIFSPEAEVRGRTVLAFLDNACIGAGKVEQYREDLAKAGLGDGFIGFNFGISLPETEDISRLVLKMEGSDLVLLQNEASIAGNGGATRAFAAGDRSMESIEWMRSQGWLDQPEYDLLKFLKLVGVYDRSLRRARSAGGSGAADEPTPGATQFLSLIMQSPVEPTVQTFTDVEDFAARKGELLATLAEPYVALWSEKAGEVLIAEGSHIDTPGEATLKGSIAHGIGPDRLLFVDLRCELGSTGKASGELRVYGVPSAA
jgi:hypothetical protein